MYLGLAEDISVGVERTGHTEVVVAAAAAEDVTEHLTAVHLYVGAARIVDFVQHAHGTAFLLLDVAAPHGSNLAAAEETAAHHAAIHKDVGVVHATVVHIAAAEDVAAVLQTCVWLKHVVDKMGFVDYLFFVVLVGGCSVDDYTLVVLCLAGIEVNIAYISVVQGDVARSPDRAALAAAVGIALDGGYAVDETRAVGLADDDVGLAEVVVGHAVGDAFLVEAHGTVPAAAIDVAAGTALDVDVAAGDEVLVEVILFYFVAVDDAAHRAGTVDVLLDRAAEQGDVGSAEHVTAVVVQFHGVMVRLHITQAAAVGVVHHGGTLVNQHVGVELLAYELRGCAVFPEILGILSQGACKTTVAVILFIVCLLTCGDVSQFVIDFREQRLQFIHRTLVHHAAHLAAAIDLIDLCAGVQVYLRVFRPGEATLACAIDGGEVAALLVAPHGAVDVHLAVEGAAVVVVAAIEGTGHGGQVAAVVQRAVIDVAGHEALCRTIVGTVGTGKEVRHLDGGMFGHVDDGPARDALREAAAVGRLNLAACQVDDRRSGDAVGIGISRRLRHAHADAAVLTATEHLDVLQVVADGARDVHQHITAVLHLVLLIQVYERGTLSGAEEPACSVQRVCVRSVIDKGALHPRLVVVVVGKLATSLIVIVAEAAAEDILHAALDIFCIGRGIRHALSIACDGQVWADCGEPILEVHHSQYLSAEVVAAVDMVADVGEAEVAVIVAVASHVGLCVTVDVGIARAGKGVEDTSVAQVDVRVAGYGAHEAAAVHELTLSHVFGILGGTSLHTGHASIQVDVGAVLGIIAIGSFAVCVLGSLADGTFLAATEYLEGIALLQVDGGAAPYLSVLTIAAAEDVQGRAEHVHALLVEDDARAPFGDVVLIIVVAVEFRLAFDIQFHLVEHLVALDGLCCYVDDHVAVDMTARVAAAIDIAADKTPVQVNVRRGASSTRGHWVHHLSGPGIVCVKLQHGDIVIRIRFTFIVNLITILHYIDLIGSPSLIIGRVRYGSICHTIILFCCVLPLPSHGAKHHTGKVDQQLVAVLVRRSDDTALVGGIVG